MSTLLQPWQILVAAAAGWISREQDAVIEYLREENRVLREQLGKRRLRLTDDQRRRLGRERQEARSPRRPDSDRQYPETARNRAGT